jgi:hypothetical protein
LVSIFLWLIWTINLFKFGENSNSEISLFVQKLNDMKFGNNIFLSPKVVMVGNGEIRKKIFGWATKKIPKFLTK